MTKATYHTPVLLDESVDGLNISPGGVYIDTTFGGGGHSQEILSRIKLFPEQSSDKGVKSRLFGFDQDADAENNILLDKNFTFVRSNFRYMKNFMRFYGVEKVNGILADLGVSSHHFDDEARGFSFRFDSRLDMRMNRRSSFSAIEVINDYEEDRLADVLYKYGELKNSRQLASHIVAARRVKKIESVSQLLDIVKSDDKQLLAKVFQALRIEVNHEMDALSCMLQSSIELLKPGGRLVVITYHSLEDRLVKNVMKTGDESGRLEKDIYGKCSVPFRIINKKVITPTDEELRQNPRSRSAKLRIAEKV